MRCHMCHEMAVGQCQSCWKFYCQAHGDILCEQCKPEQPRTDVGAHTSLTAAHQIGHAEEEGQGTSSHLPSSLPGIMEARVLERVVPIAQTKTQGSTELTLLSLEVYDDGFILHYQLRALEEEREVRPGVMIFPGHPEVIFEIRDDLGNEYKGFPGGAGGSHKQWRGEHRFTPRIDQKARTLHLRVEEVQWLAHGAGQRSRIQPGPWEFAVSLPRSRVRKAESSP